MDRLTRTLKDCTRQWRTRSKSNVPPGMCGLVGASIVRVLRAIKARPDLLAKWLTPDASDVDKWSRRLELARSFYEALCEVLLEEIPEKGAELYRSLQRQAGAVRVVDRATDIPLLDFALFAAPPTQPVLELWRERLDAAKSDRELLEVVVLSQARSAREWLTAALDEGLRSPVPFVRARALLTRGLLGSSDIDPGATTLPSHMREWDAEIVKRAKHWANRARWAKAWLERFAVADTDVAANGAFRLFLKCVDSRLFDYADDVLQRTSPLRRIFFDRSLDEIRRAITSNEKDLRAHFPGPKSGRRSNMALVRSYVNWSPLFRSMVRSSGADSSPEDRGAVARTWRTSLTFGHGTGRPFVRVNAWHVAELFFTSMAAGTSASNGSPPLCCCWWRRCCCRCGSTSS